MFFTNFQATLGLLFGAITVCGMLSFPLGAQSEAPPPHHHSALPAVPESQTTIVSGLSIPDVELIDQHGVSVHFYSDLVKGKIVAINTIFTTCTTICPLMGVNFARLSALLANQDRRKLNLISISIDPLVDTPERLNQWSSVFNPAEANWILLTGTKSNIDLLLRALQVFTPDKRDHAPTVLIGGDGAGDWSRASALRSPTILADLIQTRLARSGTHSSLRP